MFDMLWHLRPLTPHTFMNVFSASLRNVLFPSMVGFLFIKATKSPAEKLFLRASCSIQVLCHMKATHKRRKAMFFNVVSAPDWVFASSKSKHRQQMWIIYSFSCPRKRFMGYYM